MTETNPPEENGVVALRTNYSVKILILPVEALSGRVHRMSAGGDLPAGR